MHMCELISVMLTTTYQWSVPNIKTQGLALHCIVQARETLDIQQMLV